MAQQAKSYRLMFRFWLDANKDDEYELAEDIEQLKQERSFSRAIRQGLMLWQSLKNKDVGYLLELFPFVAEALQSENNSLISGNSGDSGTNTPDSEITALRADIQRLEQALLSERVPQQIHMAKQLASPATPEYTLNDLPVLQAKKSKSTGQSRQNLLNAMSSISKAPEITIKLDTPPQLSGGILAGSEKPLSEPVFDSLEI